MGVIERKVIVTWYTPEEKLPEPDNLCVLSVSGKVNGMEWDHTYAIGSYCPGEGWFFSDPCIDTEDEMDMLTVHAWCDLEPYKGGEQ